jgi:subtilase family serine protease
MRILMRLCPVVLLVFHFSPGALAQSTWVSTATKAYPVQNFQNATLLGPLGSSAPIHVAVGLLEQNADQIQPTLKRMITPGDSLYGTVFTVQQFVAQFGPAPAQVQAVENYLSNSGFQM